MTLAGALVLLAIGIVLALVTVGVLHALGVVLAVIAAIVLVLGVLDGRRI